MSTPMNKEKVTELKDIYKPAQDHVVVEFELASTKTKAGIELQGVAAKEYQTKQKPIMKIIQTADNVTNYKIGTWILPHPSFRPTQVPLIYTDATKGMQHMQMHVSDIMGVVDPIFATYKSDGKEQIIN